MTVIHSYSSNGKAVTEVDITDVEQFIKSVGEEAGKYGRELDIIGRLHEVDRIIGKKNLRLRMLINGLVMLVFKYARLYRNACENFESHAEAMRQHKKLKEECTKQGIEIWLGWWDKNTKEETKWWDKNTKEETK